MSPPPNQRSSMSVSQLAQYSWAFCLVYVIASLCWVVHSFTGDMFSALIFLMAIVLAGLRWSRGPVLMMATMSAVVWNFLFIPPQFTLHIAKPQDAVMFLLFFVVAVSMGHLTTRVHEREQARERQQQEKEALMLEREQLLEAKHKAEMIAESERLRRTVLDSVSHELKTPIAVIRAALDGLGDTNPFAGEIKTATLRLQRIVENFLEMTRIESEITSAQKDWCDLGDVIHAATDPLRDDFKAHPLQLSGIDTMPLLKLDSRLFAQALGNVLHNATLYAPKDTPIDLSAHMTHGSLELIVRDHGPGIRAGEESRIFDKFFRSPGSPAGGTGLGLAIARSFVRAQGGDIAVRNHPEGGAEFVLQVPTETHPI